MNGWSNPVFALFAAVPPLLFACSSGPEPRPPKTVETRGVRRDFLYGTTEGGELSSATTLGRVTALLFVTTYDLASQVEARRLDVIVRRHRPRANAGVVVLETPKYAVFADTFRTSLGLSYPVALADQDTLGGGGPFGRIGMVPTLIVLDRDGRERFRKEGLASSREIDDALASAGGKSSDRLP